MTRVITSPNVNHAFSEALWWLKVSGVPEVSRNGPVLVAPGPVITEFTEPQERVLFNAVRDANPVFHLMEALWMIAGDSSLQFLLPFNARMETYGENGIQWGAYGRRWRTYFGTDQIKNVIKELRDHPESRRAVVGMWDPMLDLKHAGADIPCNTHIYFDLRPDASGRRALNMTVCCRSNDMLWGAYGANVVHFSILQEVIAHSLRVDMGVYRQFSNNFHVYTDLPMIKTLLEHPPETLDYYGMNKVQVIPIIGIGDLDILTEDCQRLVRGECVMRNEFMHNVAVPLRDAYLARKRGDSYDIPAGDIDWFVAFSQWCGRRDNGNT
jgi:thymidylate synthase